MSYFGSQDEFSYGGGSQLDKPDETWITSYGDLVTNLLVFFVLLISASRISAVKFEQIKNAFEGNQTAEFSISAVSEMIVQKIADQDIQDLVEIRDEGESIAVVLKDTLLFDLGKSEIKPESRLILDEIIKIFQGLPDYARIAIEGYTDDNPVMPARYRSNWHLSVMRSLTVIEEFEKFGLCKNNCEIRGFGELNPVMPNRSDDGNAIQENQLKNRRVIIRIY
jgi:chemotaxis protein MotB